MAYSQRYLTFVLDYSASEGSMARFIFGWYTKLSRANWISAINN